MMLPASLLLAGAALTAAQSISNLPACGQLCVNNMISIAQHDFGCSAGNITCYCSNKDFGYGVRDCSDQACPSNKDAQSVIAFEYAYCASALSSAGLSSATSSGTSSAVSTTTTTVASTIIGGALGSATSHVSAVKASPGVFVVASHTISAGGSAYTSDGIVYTAARSDVLVHDASATATVTPSVASATSGKSDALGSATSDISAIKASPGVFVVGGSHTISAGGSDYSSSNGYIYTAATSDVLVSDASQTATVVPSGADTSAASTGLAGATSAVEKLSTGVFVVASTKTISAGGKGFTTSGTVYSAETSGVVIAAHGKTTTYDSAPTAGAKTTVTSMTTKTTGTAAGATTSGTSSSTSKAFAPAFATAAPGLIGAAALAVLAL